MTKHATGSESNWCHPVSPGDSRSVSARCSLGYFVSLVLCSAITLAAAVQAEEKARFVLPVPGADAASPAEMKAYREVIEHSEATIDMLPLPGGMFLMGSPASEAARRPDEGPRHQVQLEPFWMSKYEITWDAYEVWMFALDDRRRQVRNLPANRRDQIADAVTRPTEPWTDMTFGMGKKGYPAISMTQLAAAMFCQWLSAKTARYYRLPTEAEWEFACRAGTTTAYHFGDDPADLDEYAWYFENSDELKYHQVGQKKPNPWGLHDMHGNVAEWVLDQYVADFYSQPVVTANHSPLAVPTKRYPRVVRGGSWEDDPDRLRCAARGKSDPSWKQQDPQIPQSIWYHTDALHVGFRIVRPLREPTGQEKSEKWDKGFVE